MDKVSTKMGGRVDHGARRGLRAEFKELRRELRTREAQAIKRVLQNAEVVVGTLHSIGFEGPVGTLPVDHFDVSVIDEAGQAIETACWGVLLSAPKCVLAGDHLQLPPTISSVSAEKDGLGITLLERAVAMLGESSVRLLDTQYRMHELIMRWSSDNLYGGKLLADPSVAKHTLRSLPGVKQESDVADLPLVFIDTAGCGLEETVDEDESKSNAGEAELVVEHLRSLVAAGVPEADIGVITPYNGQVELITSLIRDDHPAIDVKSVDGFQGREKEAIIISLVRCNGSRTIGFLAEHRRLNVACTRARRHLCIVGDSVTVSNDARLSTLVDFLHECAETRTAHEYDGEIAADRNTEMVKAQKKAKTKSGAKPAAKPPDHSEEANESRRAKLKKKLDGFAADARKEHVTFPQNLNSYERRLVHELATELGLLHVSSGGADDRSIVVWKQGTAPPAPPKDTPPPASKGDRAAAAAAVDKARVGGSAAEAVETVAAAAAAAEPAPPETVENQPSFLAATVVAQSTPDPDVTPASNQFEALNAAPATAALAAEDASELQLCNLCQKEIPVLNYDIHVVRCEREQRRADMAKAHAEASAGGRPRSASAKGRSGPKPINHHDPGNLYGRFSRTVADSISTTSGPAFRQSANAKRPKMEQKLQAAIDKKAASRTAEKKPPAKKKGKPKKKK